MLNLIALDPYWLIDKFGYVCLSTVFRETGKTRSHWSSKRLYSYFNEYVSFFSTFSLLINLTVAYSFPNHSFSDCNCFEIFLSVTITYSPPLLTTIKK